MNDCFWWYVCKENCANCPYYKSMNQGDGKRMESQYEEDVKEALRPIKQKWRKKFVDYKREKKQ